MSGSTDRDRLRSAAQQAHEVTQQAIELWTRARDDDPGDALEAIAAALTAARLEGVLRTMRLVTRVVEHAPWGVGDPLAIRDDLLRALEPGTEVPS